jgi:hypothetical protein
VLAHQGLADAAMLDPSALAEATGPASANGAEPDLAQPSQTRPVDGP